MTRSREARFWRRVLKSFRYAGQGLAYLYATQHNFRVHVGVGLLVAFAALMLRVNLQDAALLAFAIGLVTIVEGMNTAIELTLDAAAPEFDPKVGLAKDVAAAAVLLSAMTSTVIALLVFPPYLWRLVHPN